MSCFGMLVERFCWHAHGLAFSTILLSQRPNEKQLVATCRQHVIDNKRLLIWLCVGKGIH